VVIFDGMLTGHSTAENVTPWKGTGKIKKTFAAYVPILNNIPDVGPVTAIKESLVLN
jgi:hypothetical protein